MRLPLALSLAVFSTPVMADVPRVVTDIPPVHALVASVMGTLGDAEVLLGGGADPHNFALRPSQAAALQDADLIFWVGEELTPWLARALGSLGEKAETFALLDAPGTTLRSFDHEDAHDHDDAHGHDHAEKDDHAHGHSHDDAHAQEHGDAHDHAGHHDHSHDGSDPHAWLYPANALVWLDLIAREFAAHDPDNAAIYQANAAATADRIRTLDAEIAAILEPAKGAPIAVFHDAYGYFAAHYGLTVTTSIALGDAAAPGAARLRATQETLVRDNVVCIFPEAQHDPKLVTTVAEGTSVRIGGLLDPSGTSLEPGPDAYERLMRNMAMTIATCVSG